MLGIGFNASVAMIESAQTLPLVILLMGVALTLAILIKSLLAKIGIPALIGYLILGFILKLLDAQSNFLSREAEEIFEFLAELGIISLLFRVGLESDLVGLLRQLPKAFGVLIGVAPSVHNGTQLSILSTVAVTSKIFLIKAIGFGALCLLG